LQSEPSAARKKIEIRRDVVGFVENGLKAILHRLMAPLHDIPMFLTAADRHGNAGAILPTGVFFLQYNKNT